MVGDSFNRGIPDPVNFVSAYSVYLRLTERVLYLAMRNTRLKCTKATVGYEIEHITLLSLRP